MWNKAEKLSDDNQTAMLERFQADVRAACSFNITDHPMCVCIETARTQRVVKNCLLQHPIPSTYSDWTIGVVTSALLIWFMSSFATSVGTLPSISAYIDFDGNDSTIVVWSRWSRGVYSIVTLFTFILPPLIHYTQFGDIWSMLMWGMIASVSMGAYNCKTLVGYLAFSRIAAPGVEDQSTGPGVNPKPDAVAQDEHRTNDHSVCMMTLHNFILYVHLLIAAPAIAMVLHLTQQWTEYHTIINTTLVFSTLFAVDGLSAEMANYWSHHATKQNIDIFYEGPDNTNENQQAIDMHTQLGLIRLFTFLVNAVMLLLLMTLSYPDSIGNQNSNSAIFVVVVLAFAAVFLLPDLVRELTDRVSFNSIQFRLYGDFVLRVVVLFFVLRASASARVG